jgi:hypothetical protein
MPALPLMRPKRWRAFRRRSVSSKLIGLGLCCLLRASDSTPKASLEAPPQLPQKLQVSNTERSDFPSGGTLRLKNSIGELTIEGWDQPGLEITTIKSSKVGVEGPERAKAVKLLDNVKIVTERKGDEVTVSTSFPKHSKIARPFLGMTDFDLEYRIKVPRNAKLTVEHTQGDVHIDDVSGEIHATADRGLITVHVPDGQHAIDAKTKIGAVNSDFLGDEKSKKWLGHTFLAGAPADAQKIFLRANYGDIIVLKMNQPPPPAPLAPPGK